MTKTASLASRIKGTTCYIHVIGKTSLGNTERWLDSAIDNKRKVLRGVLMVLCLRGTYQQLFVRNDIFEATFRTWLSSYHFERMSVPSRSSILVCPKQHAFPKCERCIFSGVAVEKLEKSLTRTFLFYFPNSENYLDIGVERRDGNFSSRRFKKLDQFAI